MGGDDITFDSVSKLSVSIRIYELSGSQCSMSNLRTHRKCRVGEESEEKTLRVKVFPNVPLMPCHQCCCIRTFSYSAKERG